MSPNRTSRRLQFEDLEARQLMAADLYLDFGAAFSWDAGQEQHIFDVEMLDDNRVNGPNASSVPEQLTSMLDAMKSRGMDYNADGYVNTSDVNALARDVADMVSRIYEPFAVNVKIVSSSNMNQVIDKLEDHSTFDAYIMVAGRHEDANKYGIAKVDIGNDDDNLAFAYAENLLDKAANLAGADGHPWRYVVQALARTAAHEAAHTFGLEHMLEVDEGASDDHALLSKSDIMNTNSDNGRFRYMNIATRWDGLLDDDGQAQNSYNRLAANVGLRSGGPAYVTGTGAHDVITIQSLGKTLAQVSVSAYRDDAHTDLIETQTYWISTTNGVLVEAGRGDDVVHVNGVYQSVTLRGGQGDDELQGSHGSDVLEGDTGNDDLLGAGGSDTYLYRGPRYQDHNNDDIDDSSGSDDTIDLSQLDYAITIDLASTSNQDVERRPWWNYVVNGVTYELTLWSADFNSRVGIDLKTGSGSTGIENVRGTQYNDRIFGNELDNELWGNSGNDKIYGYDGSDRLYGGFGDDLLRGGNARDYLFGEWGRDELLGEGGNDYLDGGYDNSADVLNGGVGADQFVRFYRWNLVPTKTFPYLAQVYQLEEAEDLVDFDSSEGDSIIKETVFWSW